MTATGAAAASDRTMRRLLGVLFCALIVAYAWPLATGHWLHDEHGKPISTDFMAFWGAGRLVLQGLPADAYDWDIHRAVSAAESGADVTRYASWQYPPTFLLVVPALALLSYPAAMVCWMAVGIALYLSVARLIGGTRFAMIAALAWPPVLWNTVVGQNGFLTAALLGGGIALVEKRPALAGLLFGLLTCKPQFGLLIPVALIAGGHWRVVVWAACTAVAMIAVSVSAFGIDIWGDFLASAAKANQAILVDGRADFDKVQSLFGYVRTLGGGVSTAWVAQGALVLLLAVATAWLWRSKASYDVKAAALATASILCTPYAFMYDYVALAIPLLFLGRAGFSVKEAAVVMAAGILVMYGTSPYIASSLAAALLVLGIVIGRVWAEIGSPTRIEPAASGAPTR